MSRLIAKLLTPTGFFLVVSLLAGLALCIVIPFNAGFDEETHLARLFDLSELHLIPNQSGTKPDTAPTPAEFFQLSYQRRYFLTPAFDLLKPPMLLKKINFAPDSMYDITTRSTYPPLIFMPQAALIRLGWRVLNLPVVPVAIAARLLGLLMYIFGTYTAIRWLPWGKWLLALLALSPMALFTASTINIDGFSTMITFVFTALVLKQAAAAPAPLTGRQTLALLAVITAAALARPNSFLLLPLLLVLGFRRFQPWGWFFVLWGGALVAVAMGLGWNMLTALQTGEGNTLHQIRLVLATPLHFLGLVSQGVQAGLERYYREWVGVYGHWLGVVPAGIYWLFPLGLGAALLSEPRAPIATAKMRWLTLATFGSAALGTILMMYLIYYRGIDAPIGGVQGRYFLPLAPLLLLPLSGLLPLLRGRAARLALGAALLFSLATLALYAVGLGATYYTLCGSSIYTGQPCRQPVYKNLDKSGAPEIPVKGDTSIQQTFRNSCGPIQAVNVLVKSVASQPEGQLHFELLNETSEPLAEIKIPAAQVRSLTYVTLPVSPSVGQKGKVYRIRLDANTTSAQNGLAVATSHTREYFEGKLLINGQMQNADLIFNYLCDNPYR